MNKHIILTRPAGKNASLQSLLATVGLPCLELPAIERFPLPLKQGEIPDLTSFSLVFFVSGYAVQVFFAALEKHGLHWPHGLYAGAVGTATAVALQQQGIPASQIIYPGPNAQNQDSEAFFNELSTKDLKPLSRVLVVRGQTGRQWLADKLQGLNVTVAFLPVYERKPRQWTASESEYIKKLFQLGKEISWLLTSKESVDSIFNELTQNRLIGDSVNHHFVATHPRIAEQIRYHLDKVRVECNLPEKTLAINICQPSDTSIFEMLSRS